MNEDPGKPRAACWRLATPTAVGAVAVIEIFNMVGEIERTLAELDLGVVPSGSCVLRDLLGIDRGLIARLGDQVVWLMPHGGTGVVRELCGALERRGIRRSDGIAAVHAYPEAGDEIEARMLETLARAASPLAIGLLLDQPRRWRAPGASSEAWRDRVLMRLIHPPLVAAVGASNIGKSTLLNTLAGRSVSIVADEPGTTRDHVGVMLDIGGLWVRFIDTPGVRDGLDRGNDGVELEAIAEARRIADGADLVLDCGDPMHPPLMHGAASRLRVCLRCDLGEPGWAADVRLSCRDGEGLERLVVTMRRALVPYEAMSDPGPWRFWGA